jgi:hypothetical protein
MLTLGDLRSQTVSPGEDEDKSPHWIFWVGSLASVIGLILLIYKPK